MTKISWFIEDKVFDFLEHVTDPGDDEHYNRNDYSNKHEEWEHQYLEYEQQQNNEYNNYDQIQEFNGYYYGPLQHNQEENEQWNNEEHLINDNTYQGSQFYHRYPVHEINYSFNEIVDDDNINNADIVYGSNKQKQHENDLTISQKLNDDYSKFSDSAIKLINPLRRIPTMVDLENNGIVRADYYNNNNLFNINSPSNSTKVKYSGAPNDHFMNIVLNSFYKSGSDKGSTPTATIQASSPSSNVIKGSATNNDKPIPPEFKDEWKFNADVDPRKPNVTDIPDLNRFIIDTGEKLDFSDIIFPSHQTDSSEDVELNTTPTPIINSHFSHRHGK